MIGHIIVNEKDKKKIKGINVSPVETVGYVVIPIYINKQLFTVQFDIVYDDFPILESVFVHTLYFKMNNTEIVCVAEALGLLDELKKRNYWVHPLNQDRINIKKQFFKFYNDLRDYPDKFFE
ncbi:protein ALP1-like, partial [Aphis craccivora]